MMLRNAALLLFVALFLTASASVVDADIAELVRCQKKFARKGAQFANRTIQATLKCTTAVTECQVQCEQGVFGPPCETNPPPCCDPEDPGSNPAYGTCMADADEECDKQAERIAAFELKKQDGIFAKCSVLTEEELCGAQTPGLNFAALNAGCLALDPGYECSLLSLMNCVGGPLENALTDEISGLLSPRAGEAVQLLNLENRFPGIPVVHKVKGQLAAGKVDVWQINGQADDKIAVRVRTGASAADVSSDLDPTLTLVGPDGNTPVTDTTVTNSACPLPTTCGGTCPQFKRHLPTSGPHFLLVGSSTLAGCSAGDYTLVVAGPAATLPVLVFDDIDLPVAP
jgi:hypothetical protein